MFLGASYFRALGRDEVFGLSARGLAIDTTESWGEEFPWFREFWIVRPEVKAKTITLYALLDSPRVAGAYRFVVEPGEQTRVDVECQLFLRAEVKKLGLAPLTSMFFHGENTVRPFVDFRPEAHHSDGLRLRRPDGSTWTIEVPNPDGCAEAVRPVWIDAAGGTVEEGTARVALAADGGAHRVTVTLGRRA